MFFWTGHHASEPSVVPRLVLDHAREHFDVQEAEKYAKWRLIYLARHGRMQGAFGQRFDEMPIRELDDWVREVSEALKAEMKPKK